MTTRNRNAARAATPHVFFGAGMPLPQLGPVDLGIAEITRAHAWLKLHHFECFSFGYMVGGDGFIQINADDKTDELLATGAAERYTASDGLPRGRFKLGDIRVIWIDMRAPRPGEGEPTCG